MKLISTFVFLIALSVVAIAQDTPKAELFGGYSYLRTDEETIDLTGTGTLARRSGSNLNGWNVAMMYNPTSWLGFVGDFGGAYGKINYGVAGIGTTRVNSNFHTFMFGPQFSMRSRHVTGFVRGMVGAVRLDQSATIAGQRFDSEETAFAAAFGGGVDVRFADKVSLRLFQADLFLTKFDGQGIASDTQKALRVSTGFVFRN